MAKQSSALRQRSREGAVSGNTAAKPALAASRQAVGEANAVLSRKFEMVPPTLRHELVSVAAYFRAEARGFAPGHDVEDWLAAEQDVDDLIVRRYGL